MPIESVPGTELSYYLIAFDAAGRERTDDPDEPSGRLSRRLLAELAGGGEAGDGPVTDVFLMSHGWRGDVPSARGQYVRWIGAMAACTDDIRRMRDVRPGFRPLLVGLHWPSEPFGDEALDTDAVSFDATAPTVDLDALVEQAAERVADTPAARAALRTIFQAALEDPSPPALPPDVRAAYAVLDRESGLGSGGPAAAPGDDREPFDAEAMYQAGLADEVSFGGGFGNNLLSPLKLLSFWKMKDRARQIGEGGIHALLSDLLAATEGRDVRVHLMGHSFGCIVVSAAVAGSGGHGTLARPVSSIVLVQGALSLWAYGAEIPPAPGKAGYFRSILADGKVDGPVVVTISEHDTAVGVLYPRAAGAASLFGDQVSFDPTAPALESLPTYGAVGTFGLRGPGLPTDDRALAPVSERYDFAAETVYNLECSQIIRFGGPPSGAHGDITHPEVAHAVWEAARGAA